MNLDFHYYATYLAAHYAGFAADQAMVIARSAQLVDDLTLDFLDKYRLREPNVPVDRQTISCMSMTELLGYYGQISPWTNRQMERLKEIWIGFHFPPGNEKEQVSYSGEWEKQEIHWTMQKDELEYFRLLCLPCSNTVKAYIEDFKKWKNAPFYLQLLGIRMHILADSWAHSGFLGLPLMSANDILVQQGVYIEKDEKWYRASVNENERLILKDNLEKLEFAATPQPICPAGKLWTGISYLAHGRIGSIADYGCIKFKYTPFYQSRCASPELIRDNRQQFAKAFHQMVYAMKCVRNDKSFEPEHIEETYNDKILPLLAIRKLDQSREWKNLIRQETDMSTVLPDYNLEDWANKSHIQEYENHIAASKQHLEFFRKLWQ